MVTRSDNLAKAVLCFGAKIKKNRYTPAYQFCYIKVGFKRVYISRTCFPDEKRPVSEFYS